MSGKSAFEGLGLMDSNPYVSFRQPCLFDETITDATRRDSAFKSSRNKVD